MSKSKKKKKQQVREGQSSVGVIMGESLYDKLTAAGGGYTRLDQNPEVLTCCRKVADLVSSMTIYLMMNTEKGDKRIQNKLSRHIDITPNRYMTKKTWMTGIVMTLLLHGKGNAVVMPMTEGGLLGDMVPIPPEQVGFMDDGYGYRILISGTSYDPDELLHFVLNPDKTRPWKGNGISVPLQEIAMNLRQARSTEKGFLESNWKPSLIVKVDGLTEGFSGPEGRKKLAEEYLATSGEGEPWILPAELIQVESVKPLSLSDLAIKDTVELNKKTVASMIGVPPFVLGVGEYSESEWNNFINTTIKLFSGIIEQEMTKKLIISENWYFKHNAQSLYDYDLQKLASVYTDLRSIGVVTGNEVRSRLGMSSRDEKEMDELVMLENYIPTDRLGDQKKLKEDEADE